MKRNPLTVFRGINAEDDPRTTGDSYVDQPQAATARDLSARVIQLEQESYAYEDELTRQLREEGHYPELEPMFWVVVAGAQVAVASPSPLGGHEEIERAMEEAGLPRPVNRLRGVVTYSMDDPEEPVVTQIDVYAVEGEEQLRLGAARSTRWFEKAVVRLVRTLVEGFSVDGGDIIRYFQAEWGRRGVMNLIPFGSADDYRR